MYSEEGIQWDHINFQDNQLTIDLIEKRQLSIFSLLDEECIFQKGSDQNFLNKISNKLTVYPAFIAPDKKKFQTDTFAIRHFAGEVTYNVNSFFDKNKDSISSDFCEAFSESKSFLLSSIFKEVLALKFSAAKDLHRGINSKFISDKSLLKKDF